MGVSPLWRLTSIVLTTPAGQKGQSITNSRNCLKSVARRCKVLAMRALSAGARRSRRDLLAPETLSAKPQDDAEGSTQKWLIAGALILGSILIGLDMSIVNVALPYMQRSFGVGVDRISWVVTSYFAAVGMVLPLTGWIAIRAGRKRYLLASVLTFVLASALCGLARSLSQLVIFRILQGAAGAAMMPLSQAIL